MVTGSFSISASSTETSICGSAADSVLRLPSGVALAELLLDLPDLARDPVPLLVVRAQQFDQRLALLREFPVLGLDLDLFELAQRPEPHIEDRLGLHIGQVEARHQHGLRLVLIADDADHLIEVEIGDQQAVQHFEPVLDLLQPVFGAPAQHHFAVVEPLLQHLRQAPAPAGSAPSTAPSC